GQVPSSRRGTEFSSSRPSGPGHGLLQPPPVYLAVRVCLRLSDEAGTDLPVLTVSSISRFPRATFRACSVSPSRSRELDDDDEAPDDEEDYEYDEDDEDEEDEEDD